jgi:glycosyltransferase involved in cell wall biosynthesis
LSNILLPKVLIAVPTFNRAHTIVKTIQSVYNQDYQNWDLVILDNDSKDNTRDLILRQFYHDKRIKYIFYKNHVSLLENWQRAYEFIKKDHQYFKFLCSDDVLKPEFLKEAVNTLEKTEDDIFGYTSNLLYVKDDKIIKKRKYGFFGFEKLASIYIRNYVGCPSAMLLKTKDLIKIDKDPYFMYAGDIFHALKYYSKGKKIIFDEKFLVFFQIGNNESETNSMFGTKTMIKDKQSMRLTIIPQIYSGVIKKIAILLAYFFYFLELIFFRIYNFLK